jgi:uncharacterized protein
MLKTVLDTNIIVSGTISSSGAPFEILEAWRKRRFALVTSSPILKEVERVFAYPKIKKAYGLDPKTIEGILTGLVKYSVVTPGELTVREIADDPADDMFLACAVEGEVNCIVSGDRHLLRVRAYRGIPIMNAQQFLALLEERDESTSEK